MKILQKNLRKGEIRLKAETINDLWCISNIISQGDLVRGQTFRKIKLGDERAAKPVKKKITLTVQVEKTEFHETTNILRISGTVYEGLEDIPKGSHHTLNIEENTILKIFKERWSKYQLEKIQQAASYKGPKIVICVMDRDDAVFALLKGSKYDIISKLKGDVQKKAVDENSKESFYPLIEKALIEYNKRYTLDAVVVASPAFWKDDFYKTIKDEDLKNKITLATCSSSSETAISEVLKRSEVQKVLREDLLAKDIALVEKLLEEISKDSLAAYGFKQTKEAVEAGAAEKLILTDKIIHDFQKKEKYDELENLMKLVESMKGSIHIISSLNDAGKKLDGLGGIAAILRYKLNYG